MTLDSLIEEGNEDTSTFGAELLQKLHLHALECKMNVSKLEHYYQARISSLISYYRSLEKVVSVPNFDKFNNENRHDIESNFHRTMRETEREQREKLERTQELCDKEQKEWLEYRFASAVALAKRLITQNPTQYRELFNRVGSFRSKITAHKTACRNANTRKFSSVTCAIDELEQLINFTSVFISTMKRIEILYYGDDEDFDREGNSLGSGTVEIEELDNPPVDTVDDYEVPFSRVENAPPVQRTLRHRTASAPRDAMDPVPIIDNPQNQEQGTQKTTHTGSKSSFDIAPTNLEMVTLRETTLSREAPSSVEVDVSPYTKSEEALSGRSLPTPTSEASVSTYRSQESASAGLPSSNGMAMN